MFGSGSGTAKWFKLNENEILNKLKCKTPKIYRETSNLRNGL